MEERQKSAESTDSIRNHVSKRLSMALTSRIKVQGLDLDAWGKDIEDQLFNFFNGQVKEKYKNKFRTLIFNIEDENNGWLYRHIILGAITPETLVRMTTEQMANEELQKWRTLEDQKTMEKIWNNQLEELKLGKKFEYKTHKGVFVNEIGRPEEWIQASRHRK